MPLPAESGPIPCLYECSVMHRRLSPKVHQFTYHLFFFCLDLDALPSLTARIPFFSHNRFNLYNFRDRDHLTLEGMEKASLKENILAWIRTQADAPALPTDPAALRVHLVTLPRVLGYIFNPVSFFFLSDAATAAPLCAVVQVGNTFRELKPYLLTSLLPDPAPADAPSFPGAPHLPPHRPQALLRLPLQRAGPAFRLPRPPARLPPPHPHQRPRRPRRPTRPPQHPVRKTRPFHCHQPLLAHPEIPLRHPQSHFPHPLPSPPSLAPQTPLPPQRRELRSAKRPLET